MNDAQIVISPRKANTQYARVSMIRLLAWRGSCGSDFVNDQSTPNQRNRQEHSESHAQSWKRSPATSLVMQWCVMARSVFFQRPLKSHDLGAHFFQPGI